MGSPVAPQGWRQAAIIGAIQIKNIKCTPESQPAICSGDQFNLSFLATACRNRGLVASLQCFGRRRGPRPAHQPAPLDIDHSRHCGELPGSPSKASDLATWPWTGPIDAPQSLWISFRAPRASTPTSSNAGVQNARIAWLLLRHGGTYRKASSATAV